jgi:hypothetical protein
MTIEKLGVRINKRNKLNWQKLVKGEMNRPKYMFIDGIKLCRTMGYMFRFAYNDTAAVLHDKIKVPAYEIALKEKKARNKKLRRKWKRIVDGFRYQKQEEVIDKYCREKRCNEFLDLKKDIGKKLKMKISQYMENADRRNMKLQDMMITVGRNIASMIKRSENLVRRRKEQFENMKSMEHSLLENEQVREWLRVHENMTSEWYEREAEKDAEITKQFEKDNVLYIDKKTWSIIAREGISIIVKDFNLSTRKFKIVKSMLKLKKFIQYSVVDVIDQNRANFKYLQLLKNMNMFNRFDKWETGFLAGIGMKGK